MQTLVYMLKWILNLQFRPFISTPSRSFNPPYKVIKRAKLPINHKPMTL